MIGIESHCNKMADDEMEESLEEIATALIVTNLDPTFFDDVLLKVR